MTSADHLASLLKGSPRGLTREELEVRLHVDDRIVRDLVVDLIVNHGLPIIADRKGAKKARCRIAGKDEIELVNHEVARLHSYATSATKRARHLERAWLDHHSAGSLFMRSEADDGA